MNTPIELADIDPPLWQVLVQGTAYGPYTFGQVKAFIREGRIGQHTRLAEGDGDSFTPARDIAKLGPIFRALESEADMTGPAAHTTPAEARFLISLQASGNMPQPDITAHLNRLGHFGEITTGLYLLRARMKASDVKAAIFPHIPAESALLVLDTTHQRLAWANLGHDGDAVIRTVWHGKAPKPKASAA